MTEHKDKQKSEPETALSEFLQDEKKIADSTETIAKAYEGLEQVAVGEQKKILRELDLLSDSLQGPGDPGNPFENEGYSRPIPVVTVKYVDRGKTQMKGSK
jgi:hypothetical protein